MKANSFVTLSVLLSLVLFGPASYAQMSSGARKAQEYFKHNLDHIKKDRSVAQRKPAGQKKTAKKQVAQKMKKNKIAKKSKDKSKKKNRRDVAGKGVPLVLPKKKNIQN